MKTPGIFTTLEALQATVARPFGLVVHPVLEGAILQLAAITLARVAGITALVAGIRTVLAASSPRVVRARVFTDVLAAPAITAAIRTPV